MVTALILLELAFVLAMIFIGARVGGVGLGIYGMLGVFVLVYGFGLPPGKRYLYKDNGSWWRLSSGQSEPGHGDGNESHYADHSDSQQ